MYSRIM